MCVCVCGMWCLWCVYGVGCTREVKPLNDPDKARMMVVSTTMCSLARSMLSNKAATSYS